MAKKNGHQNFRQSLGIPKPPPPYLGIIPKKTDFFECFPKSVLLFLEVPLEDV